MEESTLSRNSISLLQMLWISPAERWSPLWSFEKRDMLESERKLYPFWADIPPNEELTERLRPVLQFCALNLPLARCEETIRLPSSMTMEDR